VLFYRSESSNCYIDQDASIDSSKDGDTTNDRDLLCNKLNYLSYNFGYPNAIAVIHDQEEVKKVNITFANIQVSIPEKYEQEYKTIQKIIYKYTGSENENVIYFVKLLSDLVNNIDNETDMTAIILQLDDLIQKTID
jgi:DNA-binding ferritin-like protein (Dps family)